MNKNIALLVIIFLVFPVLVYSITTFVVQETEKVSLVPTATDPDSDHLTTTYNYPLNEKGEWQTNYGDAGKYKTTITVSDGVLNDTEDVWIIVKRKEEPPVIVFQKPKEESMTIDEASTIDFEVTATDLNKDALTYRWNIDGVKAADGMSLRYEPDYSKAGMHRILAIVSDGKFNVSKEWLVNVINVNVEMLLDGIKDVTVNENEIARLNIPDFKKYGLSYSISSPVGSSNEWQTTYDDAGIYNIDVHAEGNGFTGDKTVKVIVLNVDRPPVFDKINNIVANENDEVTRTAHAVDPDGDEVTYSAENLPESAKFEGNTFTWKTNYDTVRKEDFVDYFLDKFRALSKSFYVRFVASSKDKKIIQNIVITVKDVNRAPIIEDIAPITINEGETLKIVPNAYDLDRERIRISYSGFTSTDTFHSGFDDAGTYYVKVTASDGLLETSKFVEINIKESNRAPILEKIPDIKGQEGDNIAILLTAHDPDGDEILYSIDNPPEGSSLNGNTFVWSPGYDTASRQETKKFDIVFVASDGTAETRQLARVEISNRNRPPRIVDATKDLSSRVNEPVLMFVKAVDDDNDTLAYTWDFGLLEKYLATATHQRIFTTKGTKVVNVIVSDGIDEVKHTISVNVI